MSYYVYFNNSDYTKDFTDLNITVTKSNIKFEDLDDELCRGIFNNSQIFESTQEVSFILYFKKDMKIKGILCLTVYGQMWEVSYICVSVDEKGLGSSLLDKLKSMAKKYSRPITIYGLALYEGSQKLYIKNGFVNNQFIVGGKKMKTKKMKTKKMKTKKMKTKKMKTKKNK
jgi:hypothetical protein